MFNFQGWEFLFQKYFAQGMKPWHWGLVIAAVTLTIWLIGRLRSYFREDADDADQTLEMLSQFRNLHQQGGLSNDEFRLIRSRLSSNGQGGVSGQATQQIVKPIEKPMGKTTDSQIDHLSKSPDKHATANKKQSPNG